MSEELVTDKENTSATVAVDTKDPNYLIHMITDGKNPRGIPAARFIVSSLKQPHNFIGPSGSINLITISPPNCMTGGYR